MNKADTYMVEAIRRIKERGYKDVNPRPHWKDGTPAHTLSVNGTLREYDIGAGEFPICTLRPIAWKSAIKEILWIYQEKSNDLGLLREKYGVKYWDEWESKDWPGTIGARYGEIVRRYHLMDKLLEGLIQDPYGRRHVIDLWQYKELRETDGLAPCAFLTIWNVRNDGQGNEYLDVSLIQRSGDSLAASASGVNECQYAALLMMVARHCGYNPGMLYHYVANEQIYDRHMEQAEELVRRYFWLCYQEGVDELKARHEALCDKETTEVAHRPSPTMWLNPGKKNFYNFTIEDFELRNYEPLRPQLVFEIAV